MPRDTQTADNQTADASNGAAGNPQATDTRPGGGLGVPIDTPDPLDKYKWWILGAITLIFAVGAGLMLRRPADATAPEVVAPAPVYRIRREAAYWRRSRTSSSRSRLTIFRAISRTQNTSSISRRSSWFYAALWQPA